MPLAGRTVVDAIETCNVDKNKALVKEALRSALKSLPILILKHKFEFRNSYKSTIIQGSTS